MNRLRSILYVPGHRPELISKAARSGADAIGLVLEDSVPRDRRANARAVTASAIAELGDGHHVFVKVNSLGPDGLEDDLAAIALPGVAGLIVPRLSSAADVVEVDRLVGAAESAHRLRPGQIELILMIETPMAVLAAHAMAGAVSRVASVVCAAAAHGDLAGALGMIPSESGLERLYVLSKVLVDARAAGVATPIDGVWAGIGDLAGLEREAALARSIGYRAKLAIHPEQVAPINRTFTPSQAEVDHAHRVLAAFDGALGRGEAAVVVDGRMVDYAMVETARQTIALADGVGSGIE